MKRKGYNLEQIAAFCSGDPENLKEILMTFVRSGKQSVSSFYRYLDEENDEGISELSHKMLPLFRQLEAESIIPLLTELEQEGQTKPQRHAFFKTARAVLPRIEQIIESIKTDQNLPG